jgi:hypothetical protein
MTGTGTGAIPAIEQPMLLKVPLAVRKRKRDPKKDAKILADAVLKGGLPRWQQI